MDKAVCSSISQFFPDDVTNITCTCNFKNIKTELPGDQVLEVLAACCLPQLLGQPQQMKNKIRIKSSQVRVGAGWRM